MSSDPDFERRINNKLETIIETQTNLQEAIAGLIQVARIQDDRLDRIEKQTEENSKQIAALIEQGKETREDLNQMKDAVNVLIRVVDGHVSNHP